MIIQYQKNNAGFTLIEILIAMAVGGIVLAGIYAAYTQQMRVNNTQRLVVDMQQNVRVAMLFMERDIRLAGFNPTGTATSIDGGGNTGPVGIDNAGTNSITLSWDDTGGEFDNRDNDLDGEIDETPEPNGNPGGVTDGDEQITYSLSNDGNGNGINDALEGLNDNACHLLRNGQRLASNIDVLNFVYLGVDDTDASCEEDCRLINPATIQERADIRAVQITVIARAGEIIPGLSMPHLDDITYYNQSIAGDIILPQQNDGFRRIRLISEVRSRNSGLL